MYKAGDSSDWSGCQSPSIRQAPIPTPRASETPLETQSEHHCTIQGCGSVQIGTGSENTHTIPKGVSCSWVILRTGGKELLTYLSHVRETHPRWVTPLLGGKEFLGDAIRRGRFLYSFKESLTPIQCSRAWGYSWFPCTSGGC